MWRSRHPPQGAMPDDTAMQSIYKENGASSSANYLFRLFVAARPVPAEDSSRGSRSCYENSRIDFCSAFVPADRAPEVLSIHRPALSKVNHAAASSWTTLASWRLSRSNHSSAISQSNQLTRSLRALCALRGEQKAPNDPESAGAKRTEWPSPQWSARFYAGITYVVNTERNEECRNQNGE
jgi:hypothetical protein